jgi:hypothetical protein
LNIAILLIHFVPQLSEAASYVIPGNGICGTIFFLLLRGETIFLKMNVWKNKQMGRDWWRGNTVQKEKERKME